MIKYVKMPSEPFNTDRSSLHFSLKHRLVTYTSNMKVFLLSLIFCNMIIVTSGIPTDEQFQRLLERMNQLESLNLKQAAKIAELEHQQQSGITTELIAQQFYFMKPELNDKYLVK